MFTSVKSATDFVNKVENLEEEAEATRLTEEEKLK